LFDVYSVICAKFYRHSRTKDDSTEVQTNNSQIYAEALTAVHGLG